MAKAVVGNRYRHYKNGKEYVVLHVGIHTETDEEMVVYQGQYHDEVFGDKPVWIRPKDMWEEMLEYGGELVDRFGEID